MPQNAKTIPADRTGHPRASITASNRFQMAEISELRHRDLAAGLVTLEGKNSYTKCIPKYHARGCPRPPKKSNRLL